MKSIYITIKDSPTEIDAYGNSYPDVMTFPVNKFIYHEIPLSIKLTKIDIERIDLLSYAYYETSDYTDILLWLNNIASVHDLEVGQDFIIPEANDISRFYLENI